MRLLIVDDDPTHLLLVRQYLQTEYVVEAASNGRDALDMFETAHQEKAPYRVILMDIEMPFMDGQETLKAIRDRELSIGVGPGGGARVLMITSHEDQRNVCDSFFQGNVSGYLVKPVDRKRLLMAVASLGEA